MYEFKFDKRELSDVDKHELSDDDDKHGLNDVAELAGCIYSDHPSGAG